MGGACIAAAEDALAQLLARAAERLEVPPETLETYDGRVFPRDEPGRSISWAAALGIGHTILGKGGFEPDFTLANCMMTFVEVAVDTETGRVDLLRVVNATDAGTVIDPPGLMNQLDGCLGSAGIDSALFEETVLDSPDRPCPDRQHGRLQVAHVRPAARDPQRRARERGRQPSLPAPSASARWPRRRARPP